MNFLINRNIKYQVHINDRSKVDDHSLFLQWKIVVLSEKEKVL
jgi:hypothetical protein